MPRRIALVYQYAVCSISDQPELNRHLHIATLGRGTLNGLGDFSFDDQDARICQRIVGECDVRMQRCADSLLQRRATCSIGISDHSRLIRIGNHVFAAGYAHREDSQGYRSRYNFPCGLRIRFICHGDFGTKGSTAFSGCDALLSTPGATPDAAGQAAPSR